MKKTLKLYLIIILTLMCSFTSIRYYPDAISGVHLLKVTEDTVHLVQDAANIEQLPKHFRKCTDKVDIPEGVTLNLSGLDKLNISGSAQFSEITLNLIKDAIGSDHSIIAVDLRQESHGFINGTAVSFKNEKNNANAGLTLEQVIKTENEDLKSIQLNEPLTLYNTKKVIIPERVENEALLTENKSIGYLRVPVTDGKLPSDDMVVYFITFVNNQPKDSWLHFHCKAGIGRTTTFMIMYDIMKNCNEVSLYDIITRQVLLSKISLKDAQDFYSGEHHDFLTSFYTDYKNGCYHDKCSLDSGQFNSILNCSCVTSNTYNSYTKNSIIPKFLYVISESDMTSSEQTMVATLQGIVATQSDKQIYIITPKEPDYETWLNDLKSNCKVKYKVLKDPWKLVRKFSSFVDGYVLYNGTTSPSINNACTVASLKNAIAIDESLEAKVINYGISNLIEDCRNTDKYWAYNNLWDSGLNHSIVIELSPDKTMALRDYAITAKALVFYENDVKDDSLRKNIFSSLNNNSHCLGWGPDEHTNVSIASTYGVDVIAADWSYNLSVLSSYPLWVQTQKSTPDIPGEDGVHYVTFIMSDGDNLQWLLGSNYSSKNWYGSPYRGNFNLGWSLSPSLYYLAPTVFNKYYESASFSKYNDNFLVPPSGNGYMYPSKFPLHKLDSYTKILNDYMEKVDQHNVLILDDDALYRKDLWDKYTCHKNIDGLFYLNYAKNNSYEGEITWSNNKPIVACRDLLWGGLEDGVTVIDNINKRIELGYTDITSPDSYTFIYVHVWSKTMDNVQDVVNKLNNNPKVKIVTPDTFIKLIKENVAPTDL